MTQADAIGLWQELQGLATLAKRFFGHWRAATKYGVQSGWFGWAIAVATVLIAYWQSRQVLTQTSWIGRLLNIAWVPPLLSICGTLVIVVLFNALFLAPRRAWKMLHPFRVRLVVNTGDDVYPKGQFEPQRAAVSITKIGRIARGIVASCMLCPLMGLRTKTMHSHAS
jgi:hypothetical protein